MAMHERARSLEAGSVQVDAPGLVWGVKAAFVAYVERMADGAVTVDGGASRQPDGAFHFPLDGAASNSGHLAFQGSVRFTGHFGMLVLTFTDPTVVRTHGGLHLQVVDDEEVDRRLEVLELGDGHPTPQGLLFRQPQITRSGAELFFDKYRPGTAFDPVLLVGSPLDLLVEPS